MRIIITIIIYCLCIACTDRSQQTVQTLKAIGLQALIDKKFDVSEFKQNIGKDSVYIFKSGDRVLHYQYRLNDGYGQNDIFLDSLFLVSYSFNSDGSIKEREVVLCNWLTNIGKTIIFDKKRENAKIINHDSLHAVSLHELLDIAKKKGLDVSKYELNDWGLNINVHTDYIGNNQIPVWDIQWLIQDSVATNQELSLSCNTASKKSYPDKPMRHIIVDGKTGKIISDEIDVMYRE